MVVEAGNTKSVQVAYPHQFVTGIEVRVMNFARTGDVGNGGTTYSETCCLDACD